MLAEIACIAMAVYFEARGEPMVGQVAVAQVIMSRVTDERFPDTPCEVVKEGYYYTWNSEIPIRDKCQFSFWCDGKPETIANVDAYNQAVTASELAFKGVVLGITSGATHYHAAYVYPYWASDDEFVSLGQVGSHIFYIDTRN